MVRFAREEKKEHRFALREYSGQAPILRLQQLPLRMTERENGRSIASPFENTQGRLRSFDFVQDDTKKGT